eukprot:Clim_evm4s250 gene=Clim_evmTU4s250
MTVARAAVQKVALLACGSFNPVTNAHLRMFEVARDHLNKTGRYEVVQGIISPTNDGYKKRGLVTGQHRVAMANLATQNNDWVNVDSWEVDQPEWQTTLKVLRYFTDKFSAQGVHVKFLCGADLMETFSVPDLWKDADIEEIVHQHGMVIVSRPGSDPRKYIYEHDMLSKFEFDLEIVVEWIQNDFSATKVRRAVRRGDSIRYIVPDPVIAYIKEHGLYLSTP